MTEDRQKLIIQTEESLKECAQVARVTIGFRVTMFKINAAINDKLPKCINGNTTNTIYINKRTHLSDYIDNLITNRHIQIIGKNI